jgi:hypothetical protein
MQPAPINPLCLIAVTDLPWSDTLAKFLQAISSSAALLVALVSVVVAVLTYLRRGKVRVGNVILDFDRADATVAKTKERNRIKNTPTQGPGDKQFAFLSEYHSQGLAQSRISFWFSLIFAGLGFAVIVTALLAMSNGAKLADQTKPFISVISGIITEAVSALFFVQSNKARALMIEFFDKLRADRKLEEALRLANDLPDSIMQSRLRILLALNFVDRKSSDEFLCSVLGVPGDTKPQPPGTPSV